MSITVTSQTGSEAIEPEVAEDAASNDQGENNKEVSASEQDENIEDSDTQDDESNDNESEDESQEGEEQEDSESDDESEDDDSKKAKEDTEKPKRKSGFKKRIDKLNNRISERDNQINYLSKRLEEIENGKLSEDKKEPVQSKARGNDYGLEAPNMDDYDDYNDYVNDLTDYKVKLTLASEREKSNQEKAKTEYVNTIKTFQAKVKEFKKDHDDFEDLVSDVDDIPANNDLQKAIFESDFGPELVYELAKNPDDYSRINQLSPDRMLRAIGRLEAKIELSKPNNLKPSSKAKTSALKPLGKVKTKGKGVVKSIYNASSQAEYERIRREQEENRF